MLQSQSRFTPLFCSTLLVFLAVALQTQFSFFTNADYLGLRLNAADIILPFAGIIIAFTLCRRHSLWPQFSVKYTYLWLALLSLIFIAALGQGFMLYGEINHWGLTNKTIGWFVLCAYFLMGSWLATNASTQDIQRYLRLSLYFFLAVTTLQCCLMTLNQYDIITHPFLTIAMPLDGVMANKNSYIFWGLSLLTTVTLFQKDLIPRKVFYWFWLLLPLIFVYTGARAGIIAFPVVLGLIWFFQGFQSLKKPLLCFLIGLIAVLIVHFSAPKPMRFIHPEQVRAPVYINEAIQGKPIAKIGENLPNRGDSIRLKVLDTTLNMIKQRPILGHGLGAAQIEQEKQWGEFVNVIDCTPLWLWAETGLFGLLLFLSFYFVVFRRLWISSRDRSNEIHQKFCQAVFIMLVTFGIMSLFHEILYTRFLWFFIGLALALPINQKRLNRVRRLKTHYASL